MKGYHQWTRNSDGVILVDTKVTPVSISFQPVEEFFSVPTSYTERTNEEVLNLLNQQTNKTRNVSEPGQHSLTNSWQVVRAEEDSLPKRLAGG